MISLIVTVKDDFTKVLLQEFQREQILGACREEDNRITTRQEINEMHLCLEYYFSGIPFNNNERFGTKDDALYAAFGIVTASEYVRNWAETYEQDFGITLDLDLDTRTSKILCSPMQEWLKINRLFKIPVNLN